jgi:predicted nucleotide-binding protein
MRLEKAGCAAVRFDIVARVNHMTDEELRAYLTRNQVNFEDRPLEWGTQFRCRSGEIFSVYRTGKVVIQGKPTLLSAAVRQWVESGSEPAAPCAEAEGEPAAQPAAGRPDRSVFIVYGHDTTARDTLELLLRRMDLDPIVLENLPAAGDTIIEKLERYLGERGNVGFACVLLTPDDEGHRAGSPEEKKYRARQNVILELGMVLARLGRRRVAILRKESVEDPSDIGGLLYIPFKERVDQIKFELVRELQVAGYTPRTDRL